MDTILREYAAARVALIDILHCGDSFDEIISAVLDLKNRGIKRTYSERRVVVVTPEINQSMLKNKVREVFLMDCVLDCMIRGELPIPELALYQYTNDPDFHTNRNKLASELLEHFFDACVIYTNFGISKASERFLELWNKGCIEYRSLKRWPLERPDKCNLQ